ncbi:MAG TPA: VWA domain-containing protein [Ktedonobacterales bacterium]|nr:VWA domain-containing protein [Ktedonobacterales bacterium]
MYTQPASTLTPAVIIYLIDISDSMNEPCGSTTKIAMVNLALRAAIKDMVRRSMRDGILQRRYKLAVVAYNNNVQDVLGGVRDLPELLQNGVPDLMASGATDTAAGFTQVESLLSRQLPELQQCPAPLVCHLTDGLFTTADPTSIVRRIRAMTVIDGPVLLENIYVADGMLRRPAQDWQQWEGVLKPNDLADDYARFLFRLSSPLPETYRQNINNYGYHLQSGAAMFFPGSTSDLIRLAFVVSAATQLK